jgi:hypothetical protein
LAGTGGAPDAAGVTGLEVGFAVAFVFGLALAFGGGTAAFVGGWFGCCRGSLRAWRLGGLECLAAGILLCAASVVCIDVLIGGRFTAVIVSRQRKRRTMRRACRGTRLVRPDSPCCRC